MSNTEGVFFVIGYAGLLAAIIAFMVYTVPALREEHRSRQASRLEWPGWTLPWWMTWMWWVGLENLSPRSLRRCNTTHTGTERASTKQTRGH